MRRKPGRHFWEQQDAPVSLQSLFTKSLCFLQQVLESSPIESNRMKRKIYQFEMHQHKKWTLPIKYMIHQSLWQISSRGTHGDVISADRRLRLVHSDVEKKILLSMYSRSLVSNTIRILSNHLLGTCIVSLVFDLPFCDWRWVVIVYAYRRDSNSTHTARHRRRLRSKHMPALWASVAGTRPERAVHSLQEKHFVQVWQFCPSPTHLSSSRDYFSAK